VCGDSLVHTDTEQCDLGSMNSDTGACTSKCKSAVCGDGFLQMGEECDDGKKNDDSGACTTECKAASCGDGLVQSGVEDCDNGKKNGDGASCTSMCKNASCGDGLVQAGVEECDLGEANSDTGECTSMCKNASCGDGFVQGGEECDNGAQNGDTLACTSACANAACGDGFVQAGVEECDQGAANSDNGLCTLACKNEACGDGLVGPNEQCDLGLLNANGGACTLACKSAACGDGFLQAGEICDQGAQNSNAGACTLQCKPAACGDGFVYAGFEQCDQGAQNSNSGACTLACNDAVCGDGFVRTGFEECDLGGLNSNAGACTLTCKTAICGDGFKGPGEFCDDGNQTNNDVCNTSCAQPATALWTQNYNGEINGAETITGVTTDLGGSMYTIGTVPVLDRGLDIVVRRYKPDGTLQWSALFDGAAHGDDLGFGIVRAPNGVIMCIGTETVAPPGGKNIWLRAMSAEGGINWTRRFAGALNLDDVGYGVAVNAAGDVFFAASGYLIPNQSRDVFIAKASSFDGALIWSNIVNGAGNLDDDGAGITVDINGDVIATGSVRSASSVDAWVRKYKDLGANFQILWTKIYNGAGNGTDFGTSVAADPSGNVIVAGAETIFNQGQNGWIRKYDAAGNILWTQTYIGAANLDDVARGLAIDAAGNILVSGTETMAGGTTDGWVRKLTPAGATVWTSLFAGFAGGNDGINAVTFDLNGEIYAGGFETVAGPEGLDGWVRRYAP
jgi:cysteine-rich repeat protein